MKAIQGVVAALVVLVLAALAVGAYLYSTGRLQSFINPSAQQVGGEVETRSVVSGTVVSTTNNSVTLRQSGGANITLRVSDTTRVESLVGAGERGKTFAELAAGTDVAVVIDQKDSKRADIVSIVPEPPTLPTPTPDAIPAHVVGVVTSASPGELMLTDTAGSSVTVQVPNSVTVLTRVASGETGKTYADITPGATVQVSGLTTTSGFTAHTIGIIAQAQQ